MFTDADGNVTQYSYDALNRRVATTLVPTENAVRPMRDVFSLAQ
jgi:hypothetical protein